jgi:hypothetical protein
MRDWSVVRERYLRDALPVRLGGLAANLARVESFSDHPQHREVVAGLLEESKRFIEWTARDAQLDVQAVLVECQRQLAWWTLAWDEIWSDPSRRAEVARQAGLWSRQVLEMSGLLLSPPALHHSGTEPNIRIQPSAEDARRG